MRRAAAVLPLLALAFAAPAAPGAEPIVAGEAWAITSKVLGEERNVVVSTPRGYERGGERYPVLYLTDGNAHLVHTRGTVDFLVRNGLMPDLLIVAIANTDRTRDLTPTRGFGQRPDGAPVPVESGGGPRFLDFVEKELVPFVEAKYRTAPFRLFAGHSLGGLLALEALVERPGLFGASIAASPALAWDHDVILGKVADFLSGRKELRHAIYVTMADEEKGDAAPTRFDRLCRTLKKAKAEGFSWGAKRMEDEDHGSVVLRSHYDGLRFVFEGWRLPRDPRTRAFPGTPADARKHWAKLSERLGWEVVPPEGVLNQLGYLRLQAKDVEGALEWFRWNADLHPESANTHDSLGEALEAAGRRREALASYGRAVELATKSADPLLPAFTRNRDRLAAAGPS